jgi:asparaginyl-tRNA synthetase
MSIESTQAAAPTAPITTIADIGQHVGQSITLRGWLYNLRASGKLLFPIFRDGTGTIQGIVPKAAVPEHVFDTLKTLTLESSLTVTGRVRADARAPSGFELDVEDLTITQRVPDETPFPIQLKEAGADFLMEHRHLWIRTPRQSAILRVRATIMRAAAEYFDTSGFIRTDPPILTPNACEGTSELFEMDYFGDDKAYLTQSGQLYVEATALALGKVYSFGPTFRAEKSKTRRHLTEFWMIEPEVTYMDLDGLMTLAEGLLTHIITRVLETHRTDLKLIGKDLTKLEAILAPTELSSFASSESSIPTELSSFAVGGGSASPADTATNLSSRPESSRSEDAAERPAAAPAHTSVGHAEGSKSPHSGFPRLSYDEAHAMLLDAHARGLIETAHTYGDDFGSPDETYISSQFSKPVMVHRYPASVKAFYMQPDPVDPTKALCVDVLAPEGYGEIIGGSQRVDDYDLLKSRIESHNLPMAAFQWYLDLRRYGSVPHSGFGMGIERCVAWICGLEHVRETIPFARTLNRIYP